MVEALLIELLSTTNCYCKGIHSFAQPVVCKRSSDMTMDKINLFPGKLQRQWYVFISTVTSKGQDPNFPSKHKQFCGIKTQKISPLKYLKAFRQFQVQYNGSFTEDYHLLQCHYHSFYSPKLWANTGSSQRANMGKLHIKEQNFLINKIQLGKSSENKKCELWYNVTDNLLHKW